MIDLKKYDEVVNHIAKELESGRLKQKDLNQNYIQKLLDSYPNFEKPNFWKRLFKRLKPSHNR